MENWAHLQSFVAVAEHRSLSAAARAVGVSQPTLSRHIASLEQRQGARLFERGRSGVALTARGEEMLAHAKTMADAAARIATPEASAASTPSGTVRLTASPMVATSLLPPLLTAMRTALPQIAVELVASDETRNLLRREADIALRMYRPTQGDVIARHIAEMELGCFAAQSYLDRRGVPQGVEDLPTHDIIGYDRSTLIIDGMAAMGLRVDRDFFAFRSDDQVVCWQMARAGFGIGFNQVAVAQQDPAMVPLFDGLTVGRLPLWLTAHQEVRQSARIRAVFDFLAKGLREVGRT